MALPYPVAEEPDRHSLEKGRKLFAGPVEFMKGVADLSGLPPADLPEVCFSGRSNAGKSSLINALAGRKSLARTSNTPGRTREINFFSLGSTRHLVDLPGYGYAKAPPDKVKRWQHLLKQYLSGRANLRRVFVLVDFRHGIKPVDEEIMTLLDKSAVTFQCVLTKADKVRVSERAKILSRTRARLSSHAASYPEIIVTSSEKGDGIQILRSVIASIE